MSQIETIKEGWLHKRGNLKNLKTSKNSGYKLNSIKGELIKTWRARYFVLKSNGEFLGFNSRPSTLFQTVEPNNTFYIKSKCDDQLDY